MNSLLSFLQKGLSGEMNSHEQELFLRSNFEPSPKELCKVVRELQCLRSMAVDLPDAVDLCGTGGSGLTRINTSTIASFVLSMLGVGVAKHGNRAVSGRFGSFDLLDRLGVRFLDRAGDLELLYRQTGVAFLFARTFHPAMKYFAEARQRVGRPTFFNLLGPLLNPANVKRQIIGTAFKDKIELLALTCKELGHERVMLVRGEDGLDEVTLTGRTKVVELRDGELTEYFLDPSDFGVEACDFDEIAGGDAETNTRIATDILNGTCVTRHRDLVLVNVALALKLTDNVSTLRQGYEMALQTLTSGKAFEQFEKIRRLSNTPSILLKIAETKKKEVEQRKLTRPLDQLRDMVTPSDSATPHGTGRDFEKALRQSGLGLIAEIKQASPSEGQLSTEEFDPADLASQYVKAGVSAISVLCDKEYFKGDLEFLGQAREATMSTPLLCKDFIVDEYQIYEARHFGADAVLLIASLLSVDELTRFLAVTSELGMTALCEVHTQAELDMVLATDATVIGINNRDLHTFEVDLGVTRRLADLVPAGRMVVSESGIRCLTDVLRLPTRVDAILVGTSIMKSADKADKIADLLSDRPLLKICGVRDKKTAKFCADIGVDMIGLNFVSTCKRHISADLAKEICDSVADSEMKVVGVFQGVSADEVNRVADLVDLDFVQPSGQEDEEYVRQLKRPVILNVGVADKADLDKARRLKDMVAFVLLDSKYRGSGKTFDHSVLADIDFPFLLAGGIHLENVADIVELARPIGVDVASGVETDGAIDHQKIMELVRFISPRKRSNQVPSPCKGRVRVGSRTGSEPMVPHSGQRQRSPLNEQDLTKSP